LIEIGAHLLFAMLGSNCDLPSLCLPTSWDDRCQPLCPDEHILIETYEQSVALRRTVLGKGKTGLHGL
jgi:hypothetical protein